MTSSSDTFLSALTDGLEGRRPESIMWLGGGRFSVRMFLLTLLKPKSLRRILKISNGTAPMIKYGLKLGKLFLELEHGHIMSVRIFFESAEPRLLQLKPPPNPSNSGAFADWVLARHSNVLTLVKTERNWPVWAWIGIWSKDYKSTIWFYGKKLLEELKSSAVESIEEQIGLETLVN